MNSTPPTLAGLFFCLASADDAGLLFLPCSNTATNKRLQRVLHRQCSYTANAAKQCTELCRGFSCDCTRSTANDNRPIQEAIIPPVQCWSISQRRIASSAYQIPPPRRTLHRPAQPPYYNKVYKGAGVRPYHRSVLDGAAYHRPCQPGGTVQQQGQGGRRGTTGGSRRISFRAFAR